MDVVVVYHVTILAIGHGLLEKFWPMVIGCVLRTAGSSIIFNFVDPHTSLELLNYYRPKTRTGGFGFHTKIYASFCAKTVHFTYI